MNRFFALLILCGAGCATPSAPVPAAAPLVRPGEKHLKNIRQLTFGGENAEAYFSFDGKELIFQSTRDGAQCDAQFVMAIDGSNVRKISSGEGRVTCGYFFPDASRVLYSSTHKVGKACPPLPDHSKGYVWPLYDYDIYTAKPDGSDLKVLSSSPGYDAEATISKDGFIVFTSTRDGDLDLYKMKLDGSQVTRLTNTPGYDGGAFFSHDGKKIVWRAQRAKDAAEAAEAKALLAEHLVRPTQLEIWVMDADGKNPRQVTKLGKASFAPFFTPDDKAIVFASNAGDPKGRNFDIYRVGLDGGNLEQITFNDTFDGFPMFSPDGKKLAFSSNRNGSKPGETNVFIADWVE
jgi:Tol biopolymer transport system component